MSRQVIKSATKKRLLGLGFPEPVAHKLAWGTKFTELLRLNYDEPLHEETTMTPRSIIENYEREQTLTELKSRNPTLKIPMLEEAINSLNREKIKKFLEWFSAQKIEESGYFNYYKIDKNRSRYLLRSTQIPSEYTIDSAKGIRSSFLIPLPRFHESPESQTPQKIRDLIRKFPQWESQMKRRQKGYEGQDDILISLEDFIKEYNQEWSAYIRGKLWNSSPRGPSLNFPLGV